ncbi:MAG: hypothetical protein ABSC73_09080 [Acidimicrobiales bacterium]
MATLTSAPVSTAAKDLQTLTTGGWAILVALLGGLALAETPLGPVVAGILGVGILYQLTTVVQGSAAVQFFSGSSTSQET